MQAGKTCTIAASRAQANQAQASQERAGASPFGLIQGLLTTLIVAILAYLTWWLLKETWLKFSALLWAFIYAIIIANVVPALSGGRFQAGIEFTSSRLLRYAIASLGLTVSASVWLKLGGAGITVVLLNLVIAFVFAVLFCKFVIRMNDPLSILIAVGTGICGATAIAATGPAIKAKGEEMGLSVGVITLFGLLAMFGFPLLFNSALTGWFDGNPLAYGMWAGTGIHETAQVIAAGSQVDGALSIAVSAKFIRVLMLGPMVVISMLLFRRLYRKTGAEPLKIAVPWFAVLFVLFTFVHLGIEYLPAGAWWASFNSGYLSPAITFLLAWAFVGVGFKVKIASIAAIGLKAFLGGMAAALVAGGTALLLVKFLWMSL
ncbi:MAG: putative sulfate exporter family transporter [Chloroflexi bacterium]|nr:putative sulfate exporter family transporter [Chloroflexota bacterium]